MDPQIQVTPIPTEAERLADMVPNPGVPDQTIVESPKGQQERIVIDTDEAGEIIGWHKEVVEA